MRLKAKLLGLAFLSSSLWATPQLMPPDFSLFEDLNGLVNRQVIRLDLASYPLSQAEVKRALNAANPQTQSDYLVIQRIRAKLQEKRDGFTLEAEAYSRLTTALFGSYDQYRTSAKQSFAEGNLDLFLQGNIYNGKSRFALSDKDLSASYLAAKLNNQWLSIGLQSRVWGGGHSGSLLLNESARPFPAVGMQRVKQTPFVGLGRWQYQLFVGKPLKSSDKLYSERGTLFGARLTANPYDRIELGIGHIQYRSSRDSQQGDVLLTGIDSRLRLMSWLNLPLSVYGQVVQQRSEQNGESEYGYLLGVDGSHHISHRQTLNWYMEALQTPQTSEQTGYFYPKLPMGYVWGNGLNVLAIGVNSAYRNNDITAAVKDHHWQSKVLWAKTAGSSLSRQSYIGIEIGWIGNIPIDKYISLQLDTSLWWLKTKDEAKSKSKSDLGVRSKASMAF